MPDDLISVISSPSSFLAISVVLQHRERRRLFTNPWLSNTVVKTSPFWDHARLYSLRQLIKMHFSAELIISHINLLYLSRTLEYTSQSAYLKLHLIPSIEVNSGMNPLVVSEVTENFLDSW